jgi:hypothetical protein
VTTHITSKIYSKFSLTVQEESGNYAATAKLRRTYRIQDEAIRSVSI